MVPIVKQLCPPERYKIKCPYSRTPDRIVVHNTGNCVPAKNEVTYMINRPEEISFHVAVDDEEIRQAIPFERNAWASGDGRGEGNMYGIHIEICYSQYEKKNTSLMVGQIYEKFAAAEENAAEYIANLLKEYDWGLDKVTKHQDYDGKYCPHRTLNLGWDRFLKMVEKYYKETDDMTAEEVKEIIKQENEKINPTYNTVEEVPSYWREDIRAMMEHGIIAGIGNGRLGLTKSEAKNAVITWRSNRKLMEALNEKV